MNMFTELFASEDLVFPVVLTLKACAASLLGYVLAVVPLAFYVSRRENVFTKVLVFACTLPLIFPPVALGYLLLLVLGTNGLIGSLLFESLGAKLVFSETAVYLSAFVAGLPLVLRPVKVAFEGKSLRALEQAARVCGCTAFRTFFVVTLPCVRNAVAAALLLGTARASGEVGITMMLGGNISGRTNTLSLEIFNAVGRGDFEAATALCLVLAAVALVLYAALESQRRKSQL